MRLPSGATQPLLQAGVPCLTPKYHIFLETSGKVQFNEDDPNYHDYHQEPLEDEWHPPEVPDGNHDSWGHLHWIGFCLRFLTTIFHLISKYYIFLETSDKIKFNEDDPNYHDYHQDTLEYGWHPPSMGRFLATIFYLISKYYIFLETSFKIKYNEDAPKHYTLYSTVQYSIYV